MEALMPQLNAPRFVALIALIVVAACMGYVEWPRSSGPSRDSFVVRSTTLSALPITVSPASAPSNAIILQPEANVQAAIDAAPANSTFLFKSGVFRMQSIVPKDNDRFIG